MSSHTPRAILGGALIFGAGAGVVFAAAAASPSADVTKRITSLFEPARTQHAAISPDGRRVAYTVFEKGELKVLVRELDQAAGKEPAVLVGKDASISVGSRGVSVLHPAVTMLRWIGDRQVSYMISDSSKMASTSNSRGTRTEIRVFDADGKNDRAIVDREDFSSNYTPGLGPARGTGGPAGAGARGGVVVGVTSSRVAVSGPRPTAARGAGPDTVFAPTLTNATVLGSFSLVGFPGDRPGSVIVSGNNSAGVFAMFEYDMATGKRKEIGPHVGGVGRSNVIYDANMHPRIVGLAVDPPADRLARWVFREVADETKVAEIGPSFAREFQYDSQFPFSPHSYPLGFGEDPNILYAASNVGRPTWRIISYDLRTKEPTGLLIEDPDWDSFDPRNRRAGYPGALVDYGLVRDRKNRVAGIRVRGLKSSTHWLDADLDQFQKAINPRFPGQTVKILEWDADKQRVLAEISSPATRGEFAILERASPPRIVATIPRLATGTDMGVESVTYGFTTAEGVRITGNLLKPAGAVSPPLIIYCHDVPGTGAAKELDAYEDELHALVALGYAVATVNYRSTFGLGLAHLGPGRPEADRMAAEDLRDAAKGLTENYGIDGKRIALVGEIVGGYFALRAAEMNPGMFRAVVAINTPSNVRDWMQAVESPASPYLVHGAFLGTNLPNLVDRAALIKTPVYLIWESQTGDLIDVNESQATRLRDALKKAGTPVQYLALPTSEFTNGGGVESKRADAYVKIGKFLDGKMK